MTLCVFNSIWDKNLGQKCQSLWLTLEATLQGILNSVSSVSLDVVLQPVTDHLHGGTRSLPFTVLPRFPGNRSTGEVPHLKGRIFREGVRSSSSGVTVLGSRVPLPFPGCVTWMNPFISLCFSFLFRKMGIVTVPTSQLKYFTKSYM